MAGMLVLRCPDHPIYEGKWAPVKNCYACWQLWFSEATDEEREAAGWTETTDNIWRKQQG